MSYPFYKVVHLIGILMIFAALGATVLHMAAGGSKKNYKLRKLASMTHGTGLLLALVAGFGMMARLSLSFSDNKWLFAKIAIWLVLGFFPVALYKSKAKTAKIFWFMLWFFAALTAYLAIYKPF